MHIIKIISIYEVIDEEINLFKLCVFNKNFKFNNKT